MSRGSRRLWIPRENSDEGVTSEPCDRQRASPTAAFSPKYPPLFLHMPCVTSVHKSSCVAVHLLVSSFMFCPSFSILCLRPLLFCGAPNGELNARQKGTAICCRPRCRPARTRSPRRSALAVSGTVRIGKAPNRFLFRCCVFICIFLFQKSLTL